MRILFIILVAIVFTTICQAQTSQDILTEASQLYSDDKYEDAIRLLKNNARLFDKAPEGYIYAFYEQIAQSFVALQNYEQGKIYYLKSYNFIKERFDKNPAAYAYTLSEVIYSLMETYGKLKDYKNAIQTANEYLILLNNNGNSFTKDNTTRENYTWIYTALVYSRLSEFNLYVHNYRQSELEAKNALQALDSLKLTNRINDVIEILVQQERQVANIENTSQQMLSYGLFLQNKNMEAEQVFSNVLENCKDLKKFSVLKNHFDDMTTDGVFVDNLKAQHIISIHLQNNEKYLKIWDRFTSLINITIGGNFSNFVTPFRNNISLADDEAINFIRPYFSTLPKYYIKWTIDELIEIGNRFNNSLNWGVSSIFNYKNAEKYYIEAKNITQNLLGQKDDYYLRTLNELGKLYEDAGNYTEAEKYYIEVIGIIEQLSGTKTTAYEDAILNLAEFYEKTRNYEQSEKYLIEINNIEKTKAPNSEDYLKSLHGLISLYRTWSNYKKEEIYLIEAKRISEVLYGNNGPRYGTILYELGLFYLKTAEYSKAEDYFIQAKNIWNQTLSGDDRSSYGEVLNKLGELYGIIGNPSRSESIFKEAKDAWDQINVNDSEEYLKLLWNMRYLYQNKKEYQKAIAYAEKASSLKIQRISRDFTYYSEQQRSQVWKEAEQDFAGTYTLSCLSPSSAANCLNYNNTLFEKGFLLRTTKGIRESVYSSGNVHLINQYKILDSLNIKLQQLQKRTNYNSDMFIQMHKDAEKLDEDIAYLSSEYRNLKTDLKLQWQDVQKHLHPSEAAIEFVTFRVYDKKWTDSTLYAALLLRPGMASPKWITLFEKKELLKILSDSISLFSEQALVDKLYATENHRLYDLVWQKLEPFLNGVHTVYYSPSGLLNKIPFDALVSNEKGELLSDKYQLKLLSSTRELASLKKETEYLSNKDTIAVYGGLTYDLQQQRLTTTYPEKKKSSQDSLAAKQYGIKRFQRPYQKQRHYASRGDFAIWSYLPGSYAEAKNISSSLSGKDIYYNFYTKNQGTEESFKNLSGTATTIIHLATHGFFLSDYENKFEEDTIPGLNNTGDAIFQNPLLHSGLILSNANRQRLAKQLNMLGTEEDGVLTADEISRLNLSKTKLIVLSACETALGEVSNSEGVFGLQRAFKLAGVQTLIMSLWKVPDEATSDLMTTFYQKWLSGESKQNAFKKAQRMIRNKYKLPYYWAAFVMMD